MPDKVILDILDWESFFPYHMTYSFIRDWCGCGCGCGLFWRGEVLEGSEIQDQIELQDCVTCIG